MSAPVSHDPLVVNTQDGSCWRRRALTREGRGLYALEGTAADAPVLVLSTLTELAEHGLASMADVLPLPAGPVDGITRRIAPVQVLREEQPTPYVATPGVHAQMRRFGLRHFSNAKGGVCENCGSAPETWCPDCAACEVGCFGGHENNPCSHANASWGGR